jgi:DNA-binding response OmpR family regulator
MRVAHDENPKRILIIDDDLDLLMLLERKLLKEGYDVETAASIKEAETIVPYFNPHLILLDINVNGEDGRKLCWKLKMDASDQQMKIVVISGYDFSMRRATLFGADELLPKPLHMDYLLHRLKIHLNISANVPFPVLKSVGN